MRFMNRLLGGRRGGQLGGARRMGRRGELLILGITVAASVAALFVVLSPPNTPADGGTVDGTSGTVQTRWGPLDDRDRKLITGVRQAGLWEAPSGQQAQQRGERPRIKEIGGMIATEHLKLDDDVRQVAAKLGVVLPSKPNADQQRWMAELTGKSGDAYDRHFVLRLRAAHGKVFALIAAVRANTKNSVVRDFASRANQAVLRHMSYLESTGLVDTSTFS